LQRIPPHWQEKLNKRVESNSYRELRVFYGLTDFYSNDYLGIARNDTVTNMVNITLMGQKEHMNGSTGSRLLSGNHIWARRCEYYLSQYYNSENAMLFNSGYDANLGIMACIGERTDTIIYDELSHASIRDGIRLSISRSFSFKHNNLADLKKKMEQATGQIFIVTESIFSMDGDEAPLKELVNIAKQYNAYLIVDEAHAVGLFGNKGCGLVDELGLNEEVFIRVVTFGKGAGMHGAAAICKDEVKNYLVNFCRPFIYSTALPPNDCIAIMTAHEIMQEKEEEREVLKNNIAYFRNKISQTSLEMIEGRGPVCAIVIEGNQQVKDLSNLLISDGLGVLPVLSPTVPAGKERLRIIMHSFNTREEMDLLVELLVKHGVNT
jgi:8-amino-7-oxononanoate synthase